MKPSRKDNVTNFDLEYFSDRMKRLSNLMSWRFTREQLEARWEYIMRNDYHRNDFNYAVDVIQDEEVFRWRKFRSLMDGARAKRREREEEERLRREERELLNMLRSRDKDGCKYGHQCDNYRACPVPRHGVCHHLSKAAFKAVFAICEGRVSPDDAHRRLEERFPGYVKGFEA